MTQSINRVDHVMWICRPENLESYADELSKICRTRFYGPVEKPDLGVRLYINWAAGLEIVAPTPGDNPMSAPLRDHLEQKGEGLFGVIFGVGDIDEAKAHAEQLGYTTSPIIENSGDEPYAQETVVMKEVVVTSFINSLLVFGEIKLSENPLR